MTKDEAREKCLAARKAMPPEEVETLSRTIVERLRRLPAFTQAAAFLCYVSSKDNEVDTTQLISWLIKQGRRVYVPVSQPGGVLRWSRLRELHDLEPGRFGILEPRPDRQRFVEPPADSVAIVPGIAFSLECCRVGYGGGYYDRFLGTYGGAAIGLAFDIQIVSRVHFDPHDIPMDFVVTESYVYRRPIT